MKIACLGECMVELRALGGSAYARGFGGDTLNTAIYLARLGADVDYITALGDDPWSDEMLAAWAAEGVGLQGVARVAGRLPGLYVIETDAKGERRFIYWRKESPARDLFADAPGPDFTPYSMIYFSGITLSLYGEEGRASLLAALNAAKARGTKICFDTNYRAANWPSGEEARAAFAAVLPLADLVLPRKMMWRRCSNWGSCAP